MAMMWIGTIPRKIGRILLLNKLRVIELQDLKGPDLAAPDRLLLGVGLQPLR
jgi:hypothetical protein